MNKIKKLYKDLFNAPFMTAARLMTAQLIIITLFLLLSKQSFTSPEFLNGKSILIFMLFVFLVFLALCAVRNENLISLIMTASAFGCCLSAVLRHNDFFFSLGCSAVLIVVVYTARLSKPSFSVSRKALWVWTAALMLIFTLAVGAVCCMKYKNHWTPCYDFGIFAQMFEYMKNTGLPLTTCERDGLLSHFAVHFSPIYYLLLPFYLIFPSPLTLMIGQCLTAASGVIPFVLICHNHKLSNFTALVFSLCYLLYPAFAGGCGYYIHENNFLAPLVLWLIYFLEREKTVPVFIFGLLTLSVKEDAAVYAAVIALYFIFANKNYKCSVSLFVFSIIYFLLVTACLSSFGEGVMTGRYDNYIYDDSGLFAVIKSAVMNPLYVVQQCITEAKLKYILQMLLPLLFMPFGTKKAYRLILLIPFILVNIMTNYIYQYDIYYQYGFGSGAILLYLSVINYSDMGKGRFKLLLCAAMCSALVFAAAFGSRLNYYGYYKQTAAQRQTIDTALSRIPENASVSCSTFMLPNLYYVKELYQLETTEHETEYYVLDLRLESDSCSAEDYFSETFETVFYSEGVVGIFRRIFK